MPDRRRTEGELQSDDKLLKHMIHHHVSYIYMYVDICVDIYSDEEAWISLRLGCPGLSLKDAGLRLLRCIVKGAEAEACPWLHKRASTIRILPTTAV